MHTLKPRLPSESGTPRTAWVYLPLIVAALLALYAVAGCVTPQGDLDVPATVEELSLTAQDLETLATVADAQGKAGTAKALRDASLALDKASAALEGGGSAGDAWGALDFALRELAAVAAEGQDADLALGVAAAQIVVRRIKAALPESPEPQPSK